jgi:hypothetical protein
MSSKGTDLVNHPNPYRECVDCIVYVQLRQPVLAPAMAAVKRVTGETSRQILDRYMGGVHDRHLAGLPILPGQAAPSRLAGRFAALMAHVNPEVGA